ncbi:MAG: enoyl-CoA hydratase/isomerase family protein [Acidobacteriota bacterium]
MAKGFTTEIRGSVSIIRFDRPEIRSPLSIHVIEALAGIFTDDHVADEFRAVIVTGTDNVFASGADLREIAEVRPTVARAFAERGQALMNSIAQSKVLTIAAVNGYCFGGALDLALACDRRIASRNAVFAHPGTGLGIITGWGGTQRLPRLVGEAISLEMFFTAGRIDAGNALRIGLVEAIADDALQAAIAMASANS